MVNTVKIERKKKRIKTKS